MIGNKSQWNDHHGPRNEGYTVQAQEQMGLHGVVGIRLDLDWFDWN